MATQTDFGTSDRDYRRWCDGFAWLVGPNVPHTSQDNGLAMSEAAQLVILEVLACLVDAEFICSLEYLRLCLSHFLLALKIINFSLFLPFFPSTHTPFIVFSC